MVNFIKTIVLFIVLVILAHIVRGIMAWLWYPITTAEMWLSLACLSYAKIILSEDK